MAAGLNPFGYKWLLWRQVSVGVAGGAFCLHVSDFEFELAGCGWELDERWLGAATSWLAGWLLQPSHIPPAQPKSAS